LIGKLVAGAFFVARRQTFWNAISVPDSTRLQDFRVWSIARILTQPHCTMTDILKSEALRYFCVLFDEVSGFQRVCHQECSRTLLDARHSEIQARYSGMQICQLLFLCVIRLGFLILECLSRIELTDTLHDDSYEILGLFICVTWLIQYVWHDSFMSVKWLIHMYDMTHSYMCDMTHSYVWHDSFICVTKLICMTHPYEIICSFMCVTKLICARAFVCVHVHPYTWLVDVYDMTCWCVWHDLLMCVTWLIHLCDMAHWYVWHDSLIRVTWLVDVCDMIHWCVWHDSFICVTWLVDMCDMTRWCVWHDSLMCVTW